MGIEDLAGQAKDALNSEQGENLSDQGLEKAKEAASNLSGGKLDDQIDQASEAVDGQFGSE